MVVGLGQLQGRKPEVILEGRRLPAAQAFNLVIQHTLLKRPRGCTNAKAMAPVQFGILTYELEGILEMGMEENAGDWGSWRPCKKRSRLFSLSSRKDHSA